MSINSALKLRILIFIIFISVFGCQKADDGDVKAPEAKKTATQEIVPTRDTGDGDVNAPDFSLSDLSGRVISLKQYRGNVVILDFWATWCMPCRVSIPELGRLQERYRDRGLVVLGISLDDPKQFSNEYLRAFKEKSGINYKILRYNLSVIRDYFGGTNIGIPTMFLIDRNGKIREKILGFRPDVLKEALIDIL